MSTLLYEEKDKTVEQLGQKLAIKIWPYIYNLINSFIRIMYTTIRRSLEIILEQLGMQKRRIKT